MKPMFVRLAAPALVIAALGSAAPAALAAPCLTTPTDQVGAAAFGATVQTFIDLGVNPGVTCIENSVWTDPANFGLGTYVQGAEGQGGTIDPTGLNFNGGVTGVGNGNARDFFWLQDTGNTTTFAGGKTGGSPSRGIIWDLGGQANQLVVFVQVDHGPVPQEVLENTAWLSNDPNASDANWAQAVLVHVYGDGWSPNLSHIADGFVAVYQLADASTFRYASVTHGGPGSILQDGDNEIDAVGGLTRSGGGVVGVPAPATVGVLALALLATGLRAARRQR